MFISFAILALVLIGCSTGSPQKYESFIPFNSEDVSSVVQTNLAVAQQSGTSVFTYAGVLLFLLGVGCFVFFSRKSGLQLIVAGCLAGSIPFIVQSEYFAWITGGTMLAVAGLGIWFLWSKLRQANNDGETK